MSDLQETCPWCGGLAQDIGNGIAAHACYVIGKEIRMPIVVWNNRVKEKEASDSDNTETGKLRELVEDMYDCFWSGGEWMEPFEERMKSLGLDPDSIIHSRFDLYE